MCEFFELNFLTKNKTKIPYTQFETKPLKRTTNPQLSSRSAKHVKAQIELLFREFIFSPKN